ncbi:MAG: flavin reductase family protein [Bacteroidetes bacterium]|nr:flavin reductase family protein [Bacteroidota bacterium]
MIIDPKTLSQQEAYKLLIGSVVPRPIAFVSTRHPNGILNLAPYSFFTVGASMPPTLIFCPTRRSADGSKKDTLINIEQTGEYVINVVSESFVKEMNQTSAEVAPGVDEFELSGLTPAPSVTVRAPRVAESPVSFECKLKTLVPVGNDGPGGGTVVIGEVQMIHVSDPIISNFRLDLHQIRPVGRLAGNFYCRVTDLFEIPRP